MRARCFFAILLFTILFAQLFVSPLAAQTDPDPHRFDEAIETFRRWDAKNAIPDHPILFVGSSSIRMWKTAESFTDLPIVKPETVEQMRSRTDWGDYLEPETIIGEDRDE